MIRLVVVGGSDAGISAALRARELDPSVEPLLVLADDYPNYSICGIPYHLWRQLAHRTRDDLTAAGLDLRTNTLAHHCAKSSQVRMPVTRENRLTVTGNNNFTATVDLVLVVVGVRPDAELAAQAGAELGVKGAIALDRRMRTNLPDVYATGDCVHTYHRLLDTNLYLPLGSTAHKQGKVAGENAVGGDRQFAGSLGTQVVKVFDLVAARTGLRHHEATAHGFQPTSHTTIADDHKAYYPGAKPITIRITGDQRTGQPLGAQLVGHRDTAVAKRVDTYATALHHAMTVDAISDLDLSYTPPLSSPWDAVQIAAHQWTVRG